jgi:hypothetical protein
VLDDQMKNYACLSTAPDVEHRASATDKHLLKAIFNRRKICRLDSFQQLSLFQIFDGLLYATTEHIQIDAI